MKRLIEMPPGSEGAFVLSLDFELMWGVHDSRTIEEYGKNILGVRDVVPRLLDLFEKRDIACTWATVGMLFFDEKDELLAALPTVRPEYNERRLSPYGSLMEIGDNEKKDPYHFGLSLIREIMKAPKQEIASHTFSHFYCLEPGATTKAFGADLDAAKKAARRLDIELLSIVFPRNQCSPLYVDVCRDAGFIAFRGTENHAIYQAVPQRRVSAVRRAGRLTDAYLDITGPNCSRPERLGGLANIPASRFLRPWNAKLHAFEPLRLRRITSAMRASAEVNALFHLWFHPHNFGVNQDENFRFLEAILDDYARLREETGWASRSMADLARSAH